MNAGRCEYEKRTWKEQVVGALGYTTEEGADMRVGKNES